MALQNPEKMVKLRGISLVSFFLLINSTFFSCDPITSLSLENKTNDTLLIRAKINGYYLRDYCGEEGIKCIDSTLYELQVYPSTITELPPRTMGYFPRIYWVTISSSGFLDTVFYLNKEQTLSSGLMMRRSKRGIGVYFATIIDPNSNLD